MTENIENLKIVENKEIPEDEKITTSTMELFGTEVNMGDISIEEYNVMVAFMGNRFFNPKENKIRCACGEWHTIKKKKNKKILKCPNLNLEVESITRPKILQVWIRLMIEIYVKVKEISNDIIKEKEIKELENNQK